MNYQTSLLEDWIHQFYKQIGVYSPDQLDFPVIADCLGIQLEFWEVSSRLYRGTMIIDSRLTPQEQWQDFAHEICHKLRHYGNHMTMPEMFLELQEFQANHFALHFCVPTFMLKNLNFQKSRKETIYLIAITFGVTYEFAEKRLVIYENRILSQKCLSNV
ncbi:ImmA/IrrE family metallo-endopeptidase [Priestia megaterium]|uniref:ImmA/IrrE family metallo-endopeptidase n=1 Tax=Priestia megaterium TaxID=1404 RepID=A0A3D8WUZ5_PRIMG|nr:ImmA/IrrE family metallo-endopeptidase [Priestia megaterium]MDH3173284.1 ImmA/IrrE family metallo-endopeptidase [Priestia megaterium]RDZ07931.1 ImmA/IrrE family metallo-endopeptidase [Priestia megaterium]